MKLIALLSAILCVLNAEAAPAVVQPLRTYIWPHDYQAGVMDVQLAGRFAFVLDNMHGFTTVDVSNPTNHVRVGGCSNVIGGFRMTLSGDYAYVADTSESVGTLIIINISDPTKCIVEGTFDTEGEAIGVSIVGNRAYVADGNGGLQILDVSTPSNCVRVGACTLPGIAIAVAVAGNFAYVASQDEGLNVVDISDPSHCARIGGLDTPGSASDIIVSGHYAYIADNYSGLQVIDISNPSHPVRVGGYDTDGAMIRIVYHGNHIYAAEDFMGMVVIDVSQPTNCRLISKFKTSMKGGWTASVAACDSRVYLAEPARGLYTLFSLPNLQQTLRIDATPNLPFTLEAATNLSGPDSWQPLLTTNVATMPLDFVDFDVKTADKPQKFYRVRQP